MCASSGRETTLQPLAHAHPFLALAFRFARFRTSSRHHRKSQSCLPCSRCFHRCVQGEDVGLKRNLVDRLHDLRYLLSKKLERGGQQQEHDERDQSREGEFGG